VGEEGGEAFLDLAKGEGAAGAGVDEVAGVAAGFGDHDDGAGGGVGVAAEAGGIDTFGGEGGANLFAGGIRAYVGDEVGAGAVAGEGDGGVAAFAASAAVQVIDVEVFAAVGQPRGADGDVGEDGADDGNGEVAHGPDDT
jgi:hypothetical protein